MRLPRALRSVRYLLGARLPQGAARPHYIVFRDWPIVYARVPKVANTSVKTALLTYVSNGEALRKVASPDATWAHKTAGETAMLRTEDAARLPADRLVFAFVRDPFDRVASFYNDKVAGAAKLGVTSALDGLAKGMAFGAFLERLSGMDDRDMDVHLLPQSTILVHEGRLLPGFVGRHETIDADWARLRRKFLTLGLADPGALPRRNRRAPQGHDLGAYYADPAFVRMVRDRYAADFERFYPDADPLRRP